MFTKIKSLFLVAALVCVPLLAKAQTSPSYLTSISTLTWDFKDTKGNNIDPVQMNVEFAIEQKIGAGAFVEVAKTQALSYQWTNLPYQKYTYRLRVRSLSDPTQLSTYTNETSAIITVTAATNAKTTVTTSVTTGAAPK